MNEALNGPKRRERTFSSKSSQKASFGHPPSSFAWFDGRAHTRIKESASSARNGKRGRTDGRTTTSRGEEEEEEEEEE